MLSLPRYGSGGEFERGFDEFSDFGRQIDSDGAPSDTSSASDTAACVELIEPCREFMGEPLAVTRSNRVSHSSSGSVREVGVKARIPTAFSIDRLVRQVVNIIDA